MGRAGDCSDANMAYAAIWDHSLCLYNHDAKDSMINFIFKSCVFVIIILN